MAKTKTMRSQKKRKNQRRSILPNSKRALSNPKKRENSLLFEVERVQYLPYKYLFKQLMSESWRQIKGYDFYNIYFITVAKRIRFDLTRTSTNILGQLKAYLTLGGVPLLRVVTHVHKCNPLLFLALKEMYPLGEVAEKFVLDQTTSDETQLVINVTPVGTKECIPVIILVENLLEAENLELGTGGAPRIAYIGQSFQIIKRLQSHKRVNEASTRLKDDEELRISLVQFRTGYMGKYLDDGWKYFLTPHDPKSTKFKDRISLLERVLISFFRPELNGQHVKTDLFKDRLVSRIINRFGIADLGVSVGVHGSLGKYWSPKQPFQGEVVSYSFVNPKAGFQPGLGGAGLRL